MSLSMTEEVGDGLAGDMGGDVAHQAGDGCPLCIAVFMPSVQTMSLHTLAKIGFSSE